MLLLIFTLYNTNVVTGMKKKEKSIFLEEEPLQRTTCDFYIAPSSISGAGLGIFTMKDIPKGEIIGEPDINIIISEAFSIFSRDGEPWRYFNSFWYVLKRT